MLVSGPHPGGFAENGALALRYASVVQHGGKPVCGGFRNVMGYDRHWLGEGGSEDSNGRALWALGHCAGRAPLSGLAAWGLEWFGRTAAIAGDFQSPRAIAFAMLGADELLRRHPAHAEAYAKIGRAHV